MHLIDYDSFIRQLVPPHWRDQWQHKLIDALCIPLKEKFEEQKNYRLKILEKVNRNSQVIVLEKNLNEINGFTTRIITLGDGDRNGVVRVITSSTTPQVISTIEKHFEKVKIAGKNLKINP